MSIRPNYYQAQIKVYTDDAQDEKETKTVECFDLIDALAPGDFYLGNAWKYLFRAGRKSTDAAEDLRKAITYLEQKLERTREGKR